MEKIKYKDAIKVIVEAKRKEAEELSSVTGRTFISCLSSITRQHIGYYLDPSSVPAEIDHRTREWKIDFQTYDLRQGMVGAECIDQSVEIVVKGMDAVADAMIEWTREVHEKAEYNPEKALPFSQTNLKKRMGGLRPAISKSGGWANTSIQYVVDDDYYLLVMRICRAELELDNKELS